MRAAPLIFPLLLVALFGCGRPGDATEVPDENSSPRSIVFSGERIVLDENEAVINVEPAVTPDARGGFIVADMVESQVRLYTRTGKLQSHFGGKGSGPGEFRGVTTALRLPTGEIAVFEMAGKIAIFDPEGKRLLRTQTTPLVPIYDAAVLDSGKIALAGRLNGRSDTPLVHIWDLQNERVVNSFFNVPAHPKEFDRAYSYSGFADLAIKDSVVAVVFALQDTVFFFNPAGVERGKTPIPTRDFRPIREPMPENASPVQEQQWVQTFSTFANVFWTRDGLLLAQYFDVEGVEPKWRLVGFDTKGNRKLEFRGTELLAITPEDSLYFDDPNSMEPNQWSVASFSR